MIVQKLKKEGKDVYEVAESYYSLISSLNHLRLTQREVQLVSYAAIRGNISYTQIKEEFCVKHNTSVQTISNIISRLKKLQVFVKEKGKIKVHPAIALKFDDNIVLHIVLKKKEGE